MVTGLYQIVSITHTHTHMQTDTHTHTGSTSLYAALYFLYCKYVLYEFKTCTVLSSSLDHLCISLLFVITVLEVWSTQYLLHLLCMYTLSWCYCTLRSGWIIIYLIYSGLVQSNKNLQLTQCSCYIIRHLFLLLCWYVLYLSSNHWIHFHGQSVC